MKVAYIFPPPWDPKYPPYAMALFKCSTKQEHHDFVGFDLNVELFHAVTEQDKDWWNAQFAFRWIEGSDYIIEKYSEFLNSYLDNIFNVKADLYAVYINSHSKPLALFIAGKIKEKNRRSAIIFGGPQCFPAYEGIKILDNQFVDAVCTGEGDLVWPRILDWFSTHGNLHIDIPGIAYKTDGGDIVDGGVPELVQDLNAVPFADYSDVDFAKYGNVNQIAIMTSRGCINTCAFCSERPNFYKYRHRTAENVLTEVVKLVGEFQIEGNNGSSHASFVRRLFSKKNKTTSSPKKQVIPFVNFNDSLINGSPKELAIFCEMVIESGVKFNWAGMALIRKEMSGELLTKLKEAGCWSLAWGLESGCQRVLTLMHKGFFTMELAKKVIKETYEVGISQCISLVVGFPGETEDMFQETVEFLKEYKQYFASVGAQPMMVISNSTVYDKYQDFGLDYSNSRDYLKWQTIDGTNNYEIRLKRLDIIHSIVKEKMFKIDK
ncbi:MAG: B12-binding domain-containing radical SAM protein [Syntrophobacteraceae bacterium]